MTEYWSHKNVRHAMCDREWGMDDNWHKIRVYFFKTNIYFIFLFVKNYSVYYSEIDLWHWVIVCGIEMCDRHTILYNCKKNCMKKFVSLEMVQTSLPSYVFYWIFLLMLRNEYHFIKTYGMLVYILLIYKKY